MKASAREEALVRYVKIFLTTHLLYASTVTFAQAPARPTRTECKLWDRAYSSLFDTGAVGTVLLTIVVTLVLTLAARRFWCLAKFWLRTIFAALIAFFLAALFVVAWPLVLGWGDFHLSGVNPRYPQCRGVAFNPDGVLWANVGVGVPALDLMPTMLGLLLLASLVGMAFVLGGGWLWRQAFGLRRRVAGVAK